MFTVLNASVSANGYFTYTYRTTMSTVAFSFIVFTYENVMSSDAPIPVSNHNDVTVSFDERTATVFGPPGQAQTFSVAMMSYPTPVRFAWSPGFTQVGEPRENNDVTVVDVTTALMTDDVAAYNVTATSGQSGLSSQITIVLKQRGISPSVMGFVGSAIFKAAILFRPKYFKIPFSRFANKLGLHTSNIFCKP